MSECFTSIKQLKLCGCFTSIKQLKLYADVHLVKNKIIFAFRFSFFAFRFSIIGLLHAFTV